MIIDLRQCARNISASGKNGVTLYQFICLPNTDYFVKPEDAGGIVKSRAQFGMSADARHSATIVELDLPDGTLIKTVKKPQRGASITTIQIVRGDGLEDGKYIGTKKQAEEWSTMVEIDGQRITLKG